MKEIEHEKETCVTKLLESLEGYCSPNSTDFTSLTVSTPTLRLWYLVRKPRSST